jgi:hypothetical protein
MNPVVERIKMGALKGLIALGAILSASHALSCELSVTGSSIAIFGEIRPGDDYKLREFLAGEPSISGVSLNSPGGDIQAAGEMGRVIRERGLDTFVDAARATCASSCTILFAGGRHRFYVNADRVGGLTVHRGFKGLGFHQASNPGNVGQAASYNAAATVLMQSYLQELGVPAAARLVENSPPEMIYGVSGASALALGIATDLHSPRLASR